MESYKSEIAEQTQIASVIEPSLISNSRASQISEGKLSITK